MTRKNTTRIYGMLQ